MRNLIRFYLWSYFFRNIIRWIVGISFGDNSTVKETKQFIIVGNHNSHLDTATILSALPKNALANVYPVAAADYFGKTKLSTFISKYFLNATLIKRKKNGNGENPINQMDKLLKEGKSLIIFPEGSRGKAEELQSFKSGIGILLELNPHIPFIPVYLDGMGKALPKGDGFLVPFSGSINFGQATLIEENMNVEDIVNQVKQAVMGLAPQNQKG